LRLRVVGSGHCDVEDPTDNICPIGCGAGDAATTYLFRRYAIAFVSCVLESSEGDWIGGTGMSGDEAAGAIDMIDHAGLEMLPCRGGAPPVDGGVVDTGAPGMDASPGMDATPAMDAMPELDAGTIEKDAGTEDAGTIDAGNGGPNPSTTDSGCTSVRGSASGWMLLLLVLFGRSAVARAYRSR
jgi:hypothetical protein